MSEILKIDIDDAIQILINQAKKINQCITELESQKESINNDSTLSDFRINLELEQVKQEIDIIDKNLNNIRTHFSLDL